jgi:hypothetical protein
MRRIVRVDVYRTYETCDRTTYYVRLTTDEGFTMDPESFASHCVYDDMAGRKGLSVEEARDRALTTAHEWADFLQLEVTPYVEKGVTYEPLMTFDTYAMRREEAAEDALRAASQD